MVLASAVAVKPLTAWATQLVWVRDFMALWLQAPMVPMIISRDLIGSRSFNWNLAGFMETHLSSDSWSSFVKWIFTRSDWIQKPGDRTLVQWAVHQPTGCTVTAQSQPSQPYRRPLRGLISLHICPGAKMTPIEIVKASFSVHYCKEI